MVMEGPPFSTRAESRLHQSWGADIIGMTVLPEAKLAREAEICYASMAWVTDYDSWHKKKYGPVTVELIIETMHKNIDYAKRIIKLVTALIPEQRECECATALKTAIVTAPDRISTQMKKDLALLIGKYIQ